MANIGYREIVTKAVVGKGKKSFETKHSIKVEDNPTTILGLWVINHTFSGKKNGNKVTINGKFDVNIWYSCNDNTSTKVVKDEVSYCEDIDIVMTDDDYDGDTEVIVRLIKGPVCTNAEIDGNTINYNINKELSSEIVGDTKIRVGVEAFNDKEDTISTNQNIEEEIKSQVNDNFLG